MMNAGDDGILGGDSSSTAELSFSEKLFRTMITRYRVFRDAITPMVVPRWVFFGLSLVAFAVRIWTAEVHSFTHTHTQCIHLVFLGSFNANRHI
eukprot:m.21898 g.21898  ORF g.21898 m.21898 type:complete len:94 (+) comp8771_c0_seq2:114-395(+)